jgi:hypothetical protein
MYCCFIACNYKIKVLKKDETKALNANVKILFSLVVSLS